MSDPVEEEVNFEAAEDFLRQARQAYVAGDRERYRAAAYLVAVALNMTGIGAIRLHTEHLKTT